VIAAVFAALTMATVNPPDGGDSISVQTPTGTLAGTLELPANCPCPVVLIIAGSGPTDRFEDFVADAVAWLTKLRADRRVTTVSVVGHSEGSLIGMIAARQSKADAFVSIAGVGRPAGRIIHEQLSSRIPPEMLALADRTVAQLERGETPDSAPPALGAAQPKAALLVVDGMNHVMKKVPADQAAQLKSYSDPSLPVAPELVEAIVATVRKADR